MIPIESVHMLSTDQVLDSATMSTIDQIGHSRLPVFKGSDRNHIVGYLLVKKLITVSPEKEIPLTSIALNNPVIVRFHER
jgi:metal transporter CNNM